METFSAFQTQDPPVPTEEPKKRGPRRGSKRAPREQVVTTSTLDRRPEIAAPTVGPNYAKLGRIMLGLTSGEREILREMLT